VTGSNEIFVAGGSLRKFIGRGANSRQVAVLESVSADMWSLNIHERCSWTPRAPMKRARCQFSLIVVDRCSALNFSTALQMVIEPASSQKQSSVLPILYFIYIY